MKYIFSQFFAFCLIANLAVAAADPSAAALKKLTGDWKVFSIEAGGAKVDPGKGAPQTATVKDDRITFFSEGNEMPTFKNLIIAFDQKDAKAIDLIRGENEILPCIYELKEDTLKIAMPLVPAEKKPNEPLPRPESFDSTGKPIMVMTATRK